MRVRVWVWVRSRARARVWVRVGAVELLIVKDAQHELKQRE